MRKFSLMWFRLNKKKEEQRTQKIILAMSRSCHYTKHLVHEVSHAGVSFATTRVEPAVLNTNVVKAIACIEHKLHELASKSLG